MLGSKAFDPSDTGLLCTACSRISALLRSVLNMCHWHIAPSKTFVIRSFFFEKWLLTHVLAGPKVKISPASKLASNF